MDGGGSKGVSMSGVTNNFILGKEINNALLI